MSESVVVCARQFPLPTPSVSFPSIQLNSVLFCCQPVSRFLHKTFAFNITYFFAFTDVYSNKNISHFRVVDVTLSLSNCLVASFVFLLAGGTPTRAQEREGERETLSERTSADCSFTPRLFRC